MKQVGIIGAGAAGLAALRHVLSKPDCFSPVVWEHSSEVGGTWVFTPETGLDEFGFPIHSSMYKSLKTNLPKEIMAFPDFKFQKCEKSFIHHTEVLQYLNDYADHFKLRKWIKLKHHVDWVEPVDKQNENTSWRVSVKDLVTGTFTEVVCDALIICNGHYSVPNYPAIEHLDCFLGDTMHSHNYRVPDSYEDKTVVVLGASASGLDISLEVAEKAKKVYLSHNLPLEIPSVLPSNVKQIKGVTGATKDAFVLIDGSRIQADAILFCTGYEFTFPFLSESCGVKVMENRVTPLYKHLVNAAYPSMGFIGIPFQILPFPIFDLQVRVLVQVFSGALSLPSQSSMDDDTEHEFLGNLSNDKAKRHFHKMGDEQWQYIDVLAALADIDSKFPPVFYNIYKDCQVLRRQSLTTYKQNRYVTDGQSFWSAFGPPDLKTN